MILGGNASFAGSLADPLGASPLVAAVMWLQNTLLGTIALTIAILAVASVGLMTLNGRVNVRYGATVILGCFILFGAPSIVAGLQATLAGRGEEDIVIAAIPAPQPVVIPPEAPRPRDPYAGASMPPR